jgi:osmotically-inducible protein OsmY
MYGLPAPAAESVVRRTALASPRAGPLLAMQHEHHRSRRMQRDEFEGGFQMKRSGLVCALALLLSANAWADQAADNTGVNARDADGKSLTVFDQSETEGDRQITAKVREMIVADDSLSTNAQNIKIITVAGVVTLRGPVETTAEKTTIESKAKSVAGVTKVNNQLDTKQ